MAQSKFFSEIQQTDIKFGDYQTKSPMFFTDCAVMGATFMADFNMIKNVLPKEFRPIQIIPGKGLISIHCMEYRQCDLGPYNEVSLAALIYPPGNLVEKTKKLIRSPFTNNFYAHVIDLPVTTEISRIGGKEIFNFPKYLAEITFRHAGNHYICSLRNNHDYKTIVEIAGKKIKTKHLCQNNYKKNLFTIHTYPENTRNAHPGKLVLNPLELGIAYVGHHITVNPGNDPRADLIKKLKLGFQMHYIYAPQCEAVLYAK